MAPQTVAVAPDERLAYQIEVRPATYMSTELNILTSPDERRLRDLRHIRRNSWATTRNCCKIRDTTTAKGVKDGSSPQWGERMRGCGPCEDVDLDGAPDNGATGVSTMGVAGVTRGVGGRLPDARELERAPRAADIRARPC
eukprot:2811631-Prymnesium_polylepis.1